MVSKMEILVAVLQKRGGSFQEGGLLRLPCKYVGLLVNSFLETSLWKSFGAIWS